MKILRYFFHEVIYSSMNFGEWVQTIQYFLLWFLIQLVTIASPGCLAALLVVYLICCLFIFSSFLFHFHAPQLVYWLFSFLDLMTMKKASNQIAHVNCGHCRTTLMYPYGAPSVKCAVCQYVTNVGVSMIELMQLFITAFIINIWIYI